MRRFVLLSPVVLLAACGGGNGKINPLLVQNLPQHSQFRNVCGYQECSTDTNGSDDDSSTVVLQMNTATANFDSAVAIVSGPSHTATVSLTTEQDGSFRSATFNVDRDGVQFDDTFTQENFVASVDDYALFAKDNGGGNVSGLIAHMPDSSFEVLDYTQYGAWIAADIDDLSTASGGFFATGFETPDAAIPTSGTATYRGETIGAMANMDTAYVVNGTALLTADFGRQAVFADFKDMQKYALGSDGSLQPAGAWQDFTGTSSIRGNDFQGQTSAPGMSGDMAGTFYGPNANEVGGVWTLNGNGEAAVGSFGAKQQ